MPSPVRKLKDRLGGAIQWRAQAAVEAQTAGLENAVHGLSEQLRTTAVGITDWRARVSETFAEVAARLDEIDHRSKTNEQIRESLAEVAARLDEIDHRSKTNEQIRESLEALRVEFDNRVGSLASALLILESRVRARPFTTELMPFRRVVEGTETIGFAYNQSAQDVDFADVFRPSEEALISELSSYQRFLPKTGTAVDLGAGRGEMVEVLRQAGLSAFGIDADTSMVIRATKAGRDVREGEIGEFLSSAEPGSFSVISAIQVIEHVDTPELSMWMSKAHQTLEDGGLVVLETPNPHAIDAFKAFWLDTTHVRPYYPEALLHLVQKAGFSDGFIWVEGAGDSFDERLGMAGSYALIATK